MKKLCFIYVSFFVLALLTSGCATTQKQQGSSECLDQCELNLMTCLESMGCTDHVGQRIPCEEECQIERQVCADLC